MKRQAIRRYANGSERDNLAARNVGAQVIDDLKQLLDAVLTT